MVVHWEYSSMLCYFRSTFSFLHCVPLSIFYNIWSNQQNIKWILLNLPKWILEMPYEFEGLFNFLKSFSPCPVLPSYTTTTTQKNYFYANWIITMLRQLLNNVINVQLKESMDNLLHILRCISLNCYKKRFRW